MTRSMLPALGAGLLAAAMATGAAAEDGDGARGEAAYAATCAVCHSSVDRLARRLPRTDQAVASLDAFLAGHHAAEPGLRADIVAYLLSR